jgi:hypothetical protein
VDYIYLAQDKNQCRDSNSIMNIQVMLNAGNFSTNRVAVSFSRRILFHVVKAALG